MAVIGGLFDGAYQVEASLHRLGEVTEERLEPGGRIFPGDRLYLEIEGSRAMNVYVLNQDRVGNAFVLFPLRDIDLQNPLAPNVTHLLPGTAAGRRKYWEVTSAGGQETFLVIASRKPLLEIERQLARLPAADQGNSVDKLTLQTDQRLRGLGALAEATPPVDGEATRRILAVSRRLSQRAAGDDGIWVWEIQLDNPE